MKSEAPQNQSLFCHETYNLKLRQFRLSKQQRIQHGCYGCFSTRNIGKSITVNPLAPAILGQSITISTRNSKVLSTPLLLIVSFSILQLKRRLTWTDKIIEDLDNCAEDHVEFHSITIQRKVSIIPISNPIAISKSCRLSM